MLDILFGFVAFFISPWCVAPDLGGFGPCSPRPVGHLVFGSFLRGVPTVPTFILLKDIERIRYSSRAVGSQSVYDFFLEAVFSGQVGHPQRSAIF